MAETAALAQPDKIKDVLQKGLAQVERAAAITGRLRRFIGRRDAQRQAERLDTVIGEAIALMTIDARQCTLCRQIERGLPP